MSKLSNEELKAAMEAARRQVPCGAYRHYKGGLYGVIGWCVREHDQEPCVLYSGEVGVVFCRPVREWVEKFERQEKR